MKYPPYSVTSSKCDSPLNINKPYEKTKHISLNLLVDTMFKSRWHYWFLIRAILKYHCLEMSSLLIIMKYMSFQIVFNMLKVKNPENWLAKYIFTYNLRTIFSRHVVFGRITRATIVHHLTPKKANINASIFFQNPYRWFIS